MLRDRGDLRGAEAEYLAALDRDPKLEFEPGFELAINNLRALAAE